jgi:predicted GNAT family acetyltransferase
MPAAGEPSRAGLVPGNGRRAGGRMPAEVSEFPRVTDNKAESRFEIVADDLLAELTYRRRGNRLILLHTEVPAQLEGHGIAGRLVTAAVERAAGESLTLVPLCPFARDWLRRHQDTAILAPIDWGDGQ